MHFLFFTKTFEKNHQYALAKTTRLFDAAPVKIHFLLQHLLMKLLALLYLDLPLLFG